MITLIKPLLVNITILFSFTFNANLFFPFQAKNTISLKKRFSYGLIGMMVALFCMFYPIETLGETHFDFRMIVIMILTLYGGWLPGIMVLAVVSIYRYFIGGDFQEVGILVSILAFIIAFLFRGLFLKSKIKMLSGTMVVVSYFLTYITILYLTVRFLDLSFYLIYFSAFYVTAIALIYVIERLIRINKQMEEMVYLDKLNMVGQMAASIAHEIRNPLTTVRGFIQFLSKDTKDEQFQKFSPIIMEELDRTNKIITDYLNVAKQAPFNLSNIPITQLVDDCVQLMRPFASYSNVIIDFEKSGNWYVHGDEHYLKQAIMNVIKNGIESIHDQGTVKIDIQPSFNDTITITVQDNGCGMDAEQLKNIGLPFYTTKTMGTGLGSMITNKIVRELNGSIEYESEVGTGTTVKITLEEIEVPKA
ncbi:MULTISPECIES: ATP-binding protein [unclassified Bacillus (in: firmicutes)]|uniref:ATP-binding protein n=1 Tax=unclassified Bacillus (in: firmicutes) TaxID=185979 RepID=UPI0008EEA4F1|nr:MULTISPECIES: ATP-binding protein [unclassified Bacillus (in: firmicutes)]SFA86174.1 two-component system, sporulation sensor kinase B [Bacillus sp. UNCCL13]SFQ83604.1 two-component system, sporulation sensor kinase B [Bacillus sp. cl95]